MLALLRQISAKDLAQRPLRVALFVLAIALGTALITAMQLATDSVVTRFNDELERAGGRADLHVTFGTGEAGFDEEVVGTVRDARFVDHASAVVRGALTFTDAPPQTVELFGVDILDPDVAAFYGLEVVERTPDDLVILNDPRALFLTDTLARERGLALGDRVPLAATAGAGEYTVRGIVRGEGLADAHGGRIAMMFLPAAQDVTGKRTGERRWNIDQIDVALIDGVERDWARTALAGLVPAGLVVTEPAQRRLDNRRMVAGLRAALIGISVGALLSAMFIVYSTTTALVAYRTPMLASVVVVGATPAMLVRLVVIEAALLGTLGAVLGTFLGVALARFAVADVAVGMSLNYSLYFAAADAAPLRTGALVGSPLLGVLAAVVSAYFPARRLRTLDPVELRRGEGEGAEDAGPGWLPALWALALTAVGVLALAHGVHRQSAAWCSLAGTVIVLGAILAALPFIRVLWALASGPARRLAGAAGWLGSEQLGRSSRRSTVTVAAIALAVAVAVTASTLPKSFRSSVSHWFGFAGDAVVMSRARQGGWMGAAVSGDLHRRIAAVDGVLDASAFRVLQGQHFRGDRVAVVGLDDVFAKRAARTAGIGTRDQDDIAALIASGEAVGVSRNLHAHYAVGSGDTIELATPTGRVELPVVAVIPDYTSDRGSILVGLELLRERWLDHSLSYIAVELSSGTSMERFRASVEEALGQDRRALSVIETGALVQTVDDLIGRAFADVDALQLIVVIITLAGIVDLVVSNVIDRRRSTALVRIAGASDATVVGAVLVEAGMIGLTAGVLGAVVGSVFSWIWVRFTYPVLVGHVLDLHFAWTGAMVCTVLATITAIVAGYVMAASGLRQSAVATVRAE